MLVVFQLYRVESLTMLDVNSLIYCFNLAKINFNFKLIFFCQDQSLTTMQFEIGVCELYFTETHQLNISVS